MAIGNLLHIKKLFGSMENEDEERELYKELLLMVLARATRADAWTEDDEVSSVQRIMKEYIGQDVSSKDIRVAASSEIFETASIDNYIARVGQQIEAKQRRDIVRAMVEVLNADGKVTSGEISFFNMVVESLKLTAAETVGLMATN